jgi:hypothetical protein
MSKIFCAACAQSFVRNFNGTIVDKQMVLMCAQLWHAEESQWRAAALQHRNLPVCPRAGEKGCAVGAPQLRHAQAAEARSGLVSQAVCAAGCVLDVDGSATPTPPLCGPWPSVRQSAGELPGEQASGRSESDRRECWLASEHARCGLRKTPILPAGWSRPAAQAAMPPPQLKLGVSCNASLSTSRANFWVGWSTIRSAILPP